ncbi:MULTISPECIES: hypothetical protein [Nocardioides]|uniref:hypothetical protein n=1 Tax=Nocardioides TaxID=1839 RepID=UPI0007031885|nr:MULTISPECIES: hypothetical protein [unclassified Nocardioides]KQQ42088.1 hypothetical protein ASF50_14635 [Nocardioides sp. Leaf307]MCM3514711.1 hypothetical protein [Nocardioides sp. P86]
MATAGKRAGSRKGTRAPRQLRPRLLALALAVTAAVVAWGYLVYAAIDFGTAARDGDSGSWAFLALASVGAVACLFVGLLLVARLLRELGITTAPTGAAPDGSGGEDLEPAAPRPPGGRRAAR